MAHDGDRCRSFRALEGIETVLCCVLVMLTVGAPWLAAQPTTVGRDCLISWEPPTTNADGSALEDLYQYWLYAKTEAEPPYPIVPVGKFPVTMTTTTCLAARLTGPRYWLIVRAVDSQGNLSPASNEIELITDATRSEAPTHLKVTVTTTATTTTTTTTVTSP